VYRLNETTALIQTLDFFTPIVDDPFDFGRITAANALSDVYAMGGNPLLCMNILACPVGILADDVFRKVIEGGLAKIKEAGALLVGGHSIEDAELKYGLSVTGTVHPEKVWLNSGARAGDVLVLTKPLGIGILSTAIKGGLADDDVEERIVEVMATLNRQPAEFVRQNNLTVHSCTDITGFGLFGHLHEMAEASGVSMAINRSDLPVLAGAHAFAEMGIIPEGAHTNRSFYQKYVDGGTPEADELEMICCDPQTSGGLLLSMPPDDAGLLLAGLQQAGYTLECGVIGEVLRDNPGGVVLR
jgi:selenide,water dikinase